MLKLQYFGHLMRRTGHWKRHWCWERLKARDDRGWVGWMASLTQWTWVWANSGMKTRKPGMLVSGVAKSQTQLSDRTTTHTYHSILMFTVPHIFFFTLESEFLYFKVHVLFTSVTSYHWQVTLTSCLVVDDNNDKKRL